MGPKSRLLIVEAVLPAQTEVGGDMGGYLIDVSDFFPSSSLADAPISPSAWSNSVLDFHRHVS